MRILVEERVALCNVCEERTPHSRRRVALAPLVALSTVVGAWLLARVEVAAALTALALVAWRRDRERCWHVACERCRGKDLAVIRGAKWKAGTSTFDV